MAAEHSLPGWAALLAVLALLAAAPAAAQEDTTPEEVAALEAAWNELRSAVADGRDAEALERLRALGESGAAVKLLEARLCARLGRLDDALAAAPSSDELPDAVRTRFERRRVGWLLRAGRLEEARATLAELRGGPREAALRAEAALAAGESRAAGAELDGVIRRNAESVDTVAARLLRAEALARSGRRDESAALLREVVVRRPDHPQADAAAEAYRELTGEALSLGFGDRLRRADRYLDLHRPDDALAELALAGEPPHRNARRELLHRRGMALFRSRHSYAEAARVLTESAGLGGSTAASDEFHAARALGRADQDAAAVRAYRRFVERHPSHPRAAQALFLASWLELRSGTRGAEQRMERFRRSARAAATPGYRRAATWELGLRAFERGRYARAESLFARYANLGEGPLTAARGHYWTGRARQMLGQRTSALAAYRRALAVEPLHWYALLARRRMAELDGAPPRPFPEPPEPFAGDGPPPPVTLPADVAFYADLGLRADAVERLQAQERSLRRGPDGLQKLVVAYRRLGEASRPMRLLGGAITVRRPQGPGPADRWRWEAAFPRPWPEEVGAAARAVGLQPGHLYAVMRQESAFDPSAVSVADAIGLLQLLPSTAAAVGRPLRLPSGRDELFVPAHNVRLGGALIGRLVDELGVPLAFAAYNAGERAVRRWLGERGDLDLDLFVERIPIDQTRDYTRRVTAHLARYRYLSGSSLAWPGLELVVRPAAAASDSAADP